MTCISVKSNAPSASAQPAHSRPAIEFFVTARDTGDRLTRKASLEWVADALLSESHPTVMVDPAKTFQTLEGLGGAMTDAVAETYAKLPVAQQRELLAAYFDPETGIGYSLCRTTIHSCDFSSESYTYDEVAGDTSLRWFSIAHDKTYRIPFIKAAMAIATGSLKIFASPWSPPAWMKTNNSMLRGGKLKPEFARAWADYYGRFVHAYAKEGIEVWGLTVQNEPLSVQTWESCQFTGEEERDFVRDHLGPALAEAGLAKVKLMIWDHNRGLLYERARTIYADPQAARYVWGAAFHWYVGDHFDNVRLLHEAWPEKNLLLSEGCVERFDQAKMDDWQWGEKYGNSLMHDLNNWAVGWTDWNILLDEHGGPNHVGNFCFAPIHADARSGRLKYMNSYYYIGHFSKFIRPGAQRAAATSNDDRLLTTAFQNPDGRLAVVVLNLQGEAISFKVWVDGMSAQTVSPAHSIITLRFQNERFATPVRNGGGVLQRSGKESAKNTSIVGAIP